MAGRRTSIGLILALFANQIMACDVCLRLPGVPFEIDHPAAIEVALATRAEAEQGSLDLNPMVRQVLSADRHLPARLDDFSPRQLVMLWSQTRPAKNHLALRFTVELIFVDTDRICRVDVRFGEVLDSDPRSGPADLRMITSKAGFFCLLDKGLEICLQRKLIVVESEIAEHQNGLARLFSTSQKAKDSSEIAGL